MGPVLVIVALVMALIAADALAQAVRSEPATWPLVTYFWIAVWAAAGGLVSFHQKVKAGAARWFNVGELLGEIVTSAFVGVVTGLLCEAANFPVQLTWALAGVSGHAGGRVLFWAERLAQAWAEKRVGVAISPVSEKAAEEK